MQGDPARGYTQTHQVLLDVGEGQAEWHIIMASTMLAMIPPVFIVIFMQKQFIKGMTETEK